MRRCVAAILVLAVMLLPASFSYAGQTVPSGGGHVVVIPVEGTVEPGLAAFVSRSIRQAVSQNAAAIVLEIRTLGGLVDAALDMRDEILGSAVPVHAFVHGRAWSAGALITLACDRVVMRPGSSVGSAEPRPLEPKNVSALRSEFESTAAARGKDPKIAAAMVDASIEIPDLIEKGGILNLTASRAVEVGYADALVGNLYGALEYLGLGEKSVVVAEPSFAERFSRVVTHPNVSTMLLIVGIAGLVIESVVPGFGLPGVIGLISLATLILGRTVAQLAGIEAALLFLLGLVLLSIEAFMPGFGIFGLSGIGLLVVSLVFVARTAESAGALVLSFVVAALVLVAMFRFAQKKGLWSRLSLGATLRETSAVEVSKVQVGQEGTALTPLRPSGTAQFGQIRMSVVTDGRYVPANSKVVVESVSGNRIVVSRVEDQ